MTPILKHATYLPDLNLGSRIALRDWYEVNDRPWISRTTAFRACANNRELRLRRLVTSNITKRRCRACCDLLVTMLSNEKKIRGCVTGKFVKRARWTYTIH